MKNSIYKKIIVTCLFIISLLTMFLPWFGFIGVKELSGIVVLSPYPIYSLLIIICFLISIWFQEKSKKFLSITGLLSFFVLVDLEISKFMKYGQIKGALYGFYVGFLCLIVTGVVYVWGMRGSRGE